MTATAGGVSCVALHGINLSSAAALGGAISA